jgi:aspartate aminotransferase
MIAPTAVVSRAIDRLIEDRHGDRRVRLAGSPAVPMPAHMAKAARDAVDETGWTDSAGDPALRSAIAERLTAEGTPYRPEQILVTNGAMQALDLCFRTLLARGDAVLTHEPRFFIDGLVARAGGTLCGFPSPEEAGFRPAWGVAPGLVSDRTRVLFLNSPTNPTGYVYDDADLAAAAQLADEHGLLIVSDESYSHFVYGGRRHQTVAAHPPAAGRTLVVRSFSKDYAISGWRVGYIAGPEALIAPLAEALEWSCLAVSRIGQAVALAALRGPRDWIDAAVADAARQASAFAHAINAVPGLRCRAPDGGLNVLVHPPGDAAGFLEDLVLGAGVPAHPGEAFGAPGWFRLQFGGGDDARSTAIERIAAVAAGRQTAARGRLA